MAVLCWINAIQYSPESVSYPCTSGYYLHTMLSVTCLRLSNVSVICRVTYFQFPIQSAFLSYIGRQAASALRRIGFNTQYRASHVAVNLGTYLSFTQRIVWRKDFELILKVKMETRHLVRVSFGNEFRRSVITAELWRPEVARSGNFVSDFCVFTWQKKNKNFGCLSNCRYCADRAQNRSGPAPNNFLRVLQISTESVHFRRSYSRLRGYRLFCPV